MRALKISKLSSLVSALSLLVTGTALAFDITRQAQIVAEAGFARAGAKTVVDGNLRSPKSVVFSPDGTKIYINALEAGRTLVYEWPTLIRKKIIAHEFDSRHTALFNGEETIFNYQYLTPPPREANQFLGKPVEFAFSHDGRFLWVPYYRRSFDEAATSPSAVAVIDTTTDRIVRILPTGPIPKFVATSPDGRWAAIIHWGDNTVGLLDISSNNPRDFNYVAHLKTDARFNLAALGVVDRDKYCGECLRGAVISNDGRYLVVAEMGGPGGLVGFDLEKKSYLGRVQGIASSPRHLVLDQRDQIFVSSNKTGIVSKKSFSNLIQELQSSRGRTVRTEGWKSVRVGSGSRTIELSPDQNTLYVANNESESLVAVDTTSMQILAQKRAYPYPVGLAVSPHGDAVVLTAQGRSGVGGHVVEIWRVEP